MDKDMDKDMENGYYDMTMTREKKKMMMMMIKEGKDLFPS